jgi:ComF family protein
MTSGEFIRKYITVHKCGGCGEILPWQISDGAFCKKCRENWNADTVVTCKECFLPARECGCMPDVLKKSGALTLRKLIFYKADNPHCASMSIVYWIKHRKSKRMTDFVADGLRDAIAEELDTLGVGEKEGVFITYVPRGKQSRYSHGFDQSRLVAKALSGIMGYEFLPAFYTVRTKKQQKELDRRSRFRNAKAAIRMKKNADVSGRYAVIFDDIVTTGASMSVCAKALMGSGARGVICVTLAAKPNK